MLPEIKRSELRSVALLLFKLGVFTFSEMDFMDAPDISSMNNAVCQLYANHLIRVDLRSLKVKSSEGISINLFFLKSASP